MEKASAQTLANMTSAHINTHEELELRVYGLTRELAKAKEELSEEIDQHRRTEIALRKSESKKQAILDAMPDLIFRVQKDGTWLDLKVPEVTSLAVAMEGPAGKHFPEMARLRLEQQGMQYVKLALRKGEPQLFELQHSICDGLRDYEVRLVVSVEDEVLAMVRDITERKRLEKEVLEISAREQHRMGQDLHDGVGQLLTGVAFMSRALQHKLANKCRAEAKIAGNIVNLLVQALAQTRNLAKGLFPVDLETHGLAAGLRELSSNVEELFGISCVFLCSEPFCIPDRDKARHLYRIAQESINNAIKHGEARQVLISLEMARERLILAIKDDGVGFSPTEVKQRGMGLNIMHYRARRIGATLDIRKHSERGTVVTCSLPAAEMKQS